MAWFRPLGAVSVTLGVALAAGCGGSEDNSLFNGAGASAGAGGSAGSSSGASGGSSNGGTASGGTASGGTASGGTGNGGGAAGSGGGTSGGSAGNAGSSTGGSAGSQAGGTSGNGAGGSATGGSAGSTGGSGGASGCKINADCKDAALYCKKDQCGDATGSCEKRSEGCTQQRDTVCGCDGVTYWNSCLAGRRGMNVAAKGECSGSETRTCLGIAGLQCPAGAKCAQLGDSCNVTDAGGVCWVIPSNCPGVVVGAEYRECGPNPSAPCHSLCEAIASERPHQHDNSCPQ